MKSEHNTQTILDYTFKELDNLDKRLVTVEEAKAKCNYIKQLNNTRRHDLDVAKTKIKLAEHNAIFEETIVLGE